jgi:predicted secreted hydrolase
MVSPISLCREHSFLLTKILVVAILLSGGLISIPFYSTIANAATINSTNTTTTSTNHVITGDSQKYRIYEGLTPTMQPWEDGMRTNPMPGTFEWWYLQAFLSDGSNTQITFLIKPWMDNNGPLQPYATVSITTPNGTVQQGEVRASIDQFKAALNTVNVTIGNTWLRGDLNTIGLHFPTTKNGVGADLVFKNAAPPTRYGGSGMWFFDPSLTRFSAAVDPMPYALVSGVLTYGGKTHAVHGIGYHDKQWGTINWNQGYNG